MSEEATMRLFSLLPPTFVSARRGAGYNARNYLAWIVVFDGADASVLAQEWWELNRRFAAFAIAPLVAGIVALLLGASGLVAGYAAFAGWAVAAATSLTKPFKRRLNTRSHAVEVEAAVMLYGADRETRLAREAASLTYGYGGLYPDELTAVAAMRPHLAMGARWATKREGKLRRFDRFMQASNAPSAPKASQP